MQSSENPRLWKKVLYVDRGLPDNYVPPTFLDDTERNVFVRTYNYWTLVKASTVITQQLCVVSIFILSWWCMGSQLLSSKVVFMASVSTAIFGYILYTNFCSNLQQSFHDIKTSVLLLALTAYLSPILKTLTHTISTDTIYAMTVLALLAHLLFHEYNMKESVVASQAASLNSALFAAVCLASRLESTSHAFTTILQALVQFGFWPILRTELCIRYQHILQWCTSIVIVLIFSVWLFIHPFAAFVFCVSCILVSFCAPFLLVCMQSQKNTVHGPWDEAVIETAQATD